MKIFSRIILTITLSLLTVLLVLNITSGKIIDSIIKETWKTIIPSTILDNEYIDSAKEWVEDKLDKEEVTKIKDWIKNIKNSDEITKTKDWINNNEDYQELKKFFSETINDEELSKIKDKVLNSEEYKTLKNSISKDKIEELTNDFLDKQEKKMDFKERLVFRLFRFLANTKMKGLLIILIVLNIILLIINSWSLYKWLKNVFVSLIISGILLYSISLLINKTINSYIKINVSLDIINIPAVIMLISGFVLLFLYTLIIRMIKANSK